jgi:hypothetical protein
MLKTNLKSQLLRQTKLSLPLVKFMKFNSFKMSTFNNENEISKFFSGHEQYIANFYRKHKDNFLLNTSNEAEFEEFLLLIENLMNKENMIKTSRQDYVSGLKKSAINSREPLKEILIQYQIRLNEHGFDAETLAETLLNLGKVYQSRENFYRVYNDYTHWDFINSYRMYEIADDLKYGLCYENSFMTLEQIAKCLKGLRLSGYKSNEVIQYTCDRIKSVLLKQPMNIKFKRYVDSPAAGKQDFRATNESAGEVFYQEKFRKYIQKLMLTHIDDEEESEKIGEDSENTSSSVTELSNSVKDIINLLKEQKEIQHTLADSFDNLLDQYYKIEQALLSNPELKDQKYIKYELFKLQDKLVEGGYLTIEALNSVTSSLKNGEELENIKYKNMVSVMKNYVLTNFPDLYNEGEKQLDNLLDDGKPVEEIPIQESVFKMDELSLGQALSALTDYVKITNIEIKGEDYLNEKIIKEYAYETKNRHIAIKAEYTKAYHIVETFLKDIEPIILTKIEGCENIEALGYIYYAYANMNLCSAINESIVKKLEKVVINDQSKIIMSDEGIKHFLVGFTRGALRNDRMSKIASKVANSSKYEETTSIQNMIGIMYGLSAFKLYSSDAFINLSVKLSERSEYLSDYITNMIDFDTSLYFLSVLLKYECNVTIPHDLSMIVDYHMNLQAFTMNRLALSNRYKEIPTVINDLLVDPVKDLLIKGMEEAFFTQEIIKKYSDSLTSLSAINLPFFPDRLFGFYGHKIALFLHGKDFTLSGNSTTNHGVIGHCEVIRRVLKDKFNIYAIFIPTDNLIKFDLNTVHMEFLYSNIGFTKHLDNLIFSQLGLNNQSNILTSIDSYLNKLINTIANDPRGELVFHSEKNLDSYLNSLLLILNLHSEITSAFHYGLIENKIGKISFELEKSVTIVKTMSENFQTFLDTVMCEITGAKIDYNIFCKNLGNGYISFLNEVSKSEGKGMLTNDWEGKRLSIDILSKEELKKNISVELINNNFLWSGEYNPYEDWEEEIKSHYDHFNYFVKNGETNHLFNSHKLGNRRVPQGIYPHPSKRRLIKQPAFEAQNEAKSGYEEELRSYIEQNKTLIQQEALKNNALAQKEIPLELGLKVNLLNVNNSLKQNLEDSEILKYISNFEFIDSLINEHLKSNEKAQSGQFLKRNSNFFKSYYERMATPQQHDDFDKFVMREYYNNEKILELDSSKSPEDNLKSIEEKMKKKLIQNEDLDTISIYNPNTEEFKFDIKKVLSAVKLSNDDEDINLTPHDFLYTKRRQAERNLILLKIIKTLSDPSASLSQNETRYIKHVIDQVSNTKNTNLNHIALPTHVTKLKFSDLSANDVYSLNSLYNVEIDKKYNDYSLSELTLQFSLFIDNATINKLLLSLYENFVIKKNKSQTSPIFNYENKEQSLISNEVKETLWRLSSFMTEEDKIKLRDMLRVKRNKTKFDKIWLELDEKSLNDFIDESNLHENKFNHLEKWIKRKEKEVENRINLPPENLALSDKQVQKLLQKKDKAFRKTLLRQIFQKDDEKLITRIEARSFLEEYLSTIYSFNFKYPVEIKDIFNALLDLPVLLEEDRQAIKAYRLFFNIDETSPFEYLAVDPVKMEDEKLHIKGENYSSYFDENLKKRIKSASIPFIPAITERIKSIKSLN